jgi:hypothetical protein
LICALYAGTLRVAEPVVASVPTSSVMRYCDAGSFSFVVRYYEAVSPSRSQQGSCETEEHTLRKRLRSPEKLGIVPETGRNE